jgi:hypothetical protein
MSFDKIVDSDYGQVAKLTFKDVDTDAAADISAYSTTIQMLFSDPLGNVTTKTATFDSDGTDGIIKYTIETGLLTRPGKWKVRGRVKSANAKLTTEAHTFEVLVKEN